MKKCRVCHRILDHSLFPKLTKSSDGFHYLCKECSNRQSKDYYDKNRDRLLVGINKRVKLHTEAKQRVVYEYLLTNPCIDCQKSNPIILDFDHVSGTKFKKIARMMSSHSIKKIMDEIAKCEVRCANCHRRKTAKQFNHHSNNKSSKRYNKNKEIILDYLGSHPCISCGETDPIVLEFDHLKDKIKPITHMMNHPTEVLLLEIEKCQILCTNCHRIKTAIDLNYYRYRFSLENI